MIKNRCENNVTTVEFQRNTLHRQSIHGKRDVFCIKQNVTHIESSLEVVKVLIETLTFAFQKQLDLRCSIDLFILFYCTCYSTSQGLLNKKVVEKVLNITKKPGNTEYVYILTNLQIVIGQGKCQVYTSGPNNVFFPQSKNIKAFKLLNQLSQTTLTNNKFLLVLL